MVKRYFGSYLLLMVGISWLFNTAYADKSSTLTTIATVGETHSLTNTHQTPLPVIDVNDHAQIKKIAQSQAKRAVASIYQVSTPSMQVGYVKSHQIKDIKGFESPFAIVGCDQKSLQWLTHYANKLNSLHTSIYIVNCDSKNTYEQIKQLIKGQVLAVPGQEFAKRFQVKHYPF
jgi:integrating conjugative element protein (TIGR03765 family)